MPNLEWNIKTWDETYDWSNHGEEWSKAWGNSEAQWFSAIFPRIHCFLPTNKILEIGPGFGRWTRFLLPQCDLFTGVDLSQACLDGCTKRFHDAPHATFVKNDGLMLPHNQSFDFAFSFDSLVHADHQVFENYIPQILSSLTPNGVAFLHHSNLAAIHSITPEDSYLHGRAKDVSADIIAELVRTHGGHVLIQETFNWGHAQEIDAFTLFGAGKSDEVSIRISNSNFGSEVATINQVHSHYSSPELKRYKKT